ncbi:hypothetical protein D910_02310, partial [Dendroctonus ponderosae]
MHMLNQDTYKNQKSLILRKHVMVRVGGGWDTLAHYLDKHDPCRCKGQHRPTQSARLIPGRAPDLHGAQVFYDRSATSPASLPPTINGVSNGQHSLGPPMNSLNRSRSRSPSHLYPDSRRSVSPNFPRKNLVPPSHNRSRSPTPNFTSTHHTKLATNKSPQHVVMKSEAVLQVSSESHSSDNHSDTSSQMSDEGYRSLGIVQDKNKKRSSVYSQNSAEDVEENEDELNDFGLRKTNFSQRIYENDSKLLRRTPEPPRSHPQSPTTETDRQHSVGSMRSSPRPEERPQLKRASSSDKVITSPKRAPAVPPITTKKADSKTNTWNGRQRPVRSSIGPDTYVSPFQRNATGRRSVSALGERRTSMSANSSPVKSRLKQELLNAVKKADDDESIAIQ